MRGKDPHIGDAARLLHQFVAGPTVFLSAHLGTPRERGPLWRSRCAFAGPEYGEDYLTFAAGDTLERWALAAAVEFEGLRFAYVIKSQLLCAANRQECFVLD